MGKLLSLMPGTIHFNNEPGLVTIEVSDIGTDRRLLPKLQAIDFPASKYNPKCTLRRCHLLAECSGS